MFERTCDPTCIIIYKEPHFIIYYQLATEESWVIYGDCTGDGTCYEGAQNPKPELDCPVRPEIKCTCSLRGVYL